MHLPKTAGLSLRQAAAAQYREGEHVHIRGGSHRDERAFMWGLPAERRKRARLVTGHQRFGVHETLEQPCSYAVVMRHPVDRIQSLFRWLHTRRRAKTDAYLTGGFEAFALGNWTADLDNGQTRLLACHPECGGGPIRSRATEADFRVAVDNLRTISVVGEHDRLETFVVHLAEFARWKKPIELPHRHRSRQVHDAAVAETRILDAIEERNRWDLLLFEEARRMAR